MKLKSLASVITVPRKFAEVEFHGLANDSKKVVPGDLFFGVPGIKTDGGLYLEEAFSRGAKAALVENKIISSFGIPVIPVNNIRKIQGLVAAIFYNHPAQQLRVIGVTGTNGKTTVTHLISHLLNHAGIRTGLIGTLWIDDGLQKIQAIRTTPDSIDLQYYLSRMVLNGLKAVVIEVSSHALALDRVSGIEFDVAILTNIAQDHFDFHKDHQQYFEAKSRLFKSLRAGNKQPKYIVLNADDHSAAKIATVSQVPVLYYGTAEDAETRLTEVISQTKRNIFTVNFQSEATQLKSKLPGLFNIYNILAAITVARQEDVPLQKIKRAVKSFRGVPGRYQEVNFGQPFRIIVDFAHNPAALENILAMARVHTKGRLILVFGCEGEKDRIKRPLMGKIAVQQADIAILTSDNIYFEDVNQIFNDVLTGLAKNEQLRMMIEPDRKIAIQKAIDLAGADDFIIIAGKGHEQYLVNGADKIPFNDEAVLRELLEI